MLSQIEKSLADEVTENLEQSLKPRLPWRKNKRKCLSETQLGQLKGNFFQKIGKNQSLETLDRMKIKFY